MTDFPSTTERTIQLDPQKKFSDLFEEFQRPIFYYLLRMTQNPDTAEDLTQETFIRVHRGLSAFRGNSSYSTWIYRIATNASLDYLRSKVSQVEKTISSLDDIDAYGNWIPDPKSTPPELATAQAEMSECVQRFIRNLPPSYRAPLILADLQGLKNREIAEVLEVPLSTVKIRLHRARRRLQAALNAGCDFEHDERNVLVCEERSSKKEV